MGAITAVKKTMRILFRTAISVLVMSSVPAVSAADVPSFVAAGEIEALFADDADPATAQPDEPDPDANASLLGESEGISDDEAQLEFARILARVKGQEHTAIDAYQKILTASSDKELWREYAGLLHRAGRWGKSADAYARAGAETLRRDEVFAHAHALQESGQPAAGTRVLAPLLESLPEDREVLDFWIALHRRAKTLPAARDELERLLQKRPECTFTLNHAVELSVDSGDGIAAEKYVDRLLVLNANSAEIWNRKAGLAMARRDFTAAADAYARALAINPANADSRRQLYRVQQILGRFQEAEEVIEPLFHPSIDQIVSSRLQTLGVTRSSPALQVWLEGNAQAATPFALYEDLRRATQDGTLMPAMAPDAQAALLVVLEETRKHYEVQSAAWTERAASKASRSGRNIDAVRLYRRLGAEEPDNIAALYGLAGALQAGGDIELARQAYECLVALNPSDPVAAGALRKAADLLRDSIQMISRFQNEDSPGRLANITRSEFALLYAMRIDDRFQLQLEPKFWLEAPGDGGLFTAQGFEAALRYRHNELLSASVRFGVKAYNQPGAPTTFTGGVDLLFNAWDRARIALGFSREDIVKNRFNIIQGTQADVIRIAAESDITTRLRTTAAAQGLRYSDSNLQGIVAASVSYSILKTPGDLAIGAGALGMWTEKQSEEFYLAGELSDVRYPYWTPSQYGQGAVSLRWQHDLAPNAFAGQNELSYGAAILGSFDTTSNLLLGAEIYLRWEVVQNFIFEAAASMQRSRSWNGSQATVNAEYRF